MSKLYDRVRELIQRALDEEELIGLHYEPDNFEVGFIREFVGDSFHLERLDRYGQPWGSFVGKLESVLRVQVGTQYMQAVQLLLERSKLPSEISGAPADLEFESILEFTQRQNILVGVHQEDGSVMIGKVRGYTEDYVELEEINHLGYEDGLRVFPLEDVVRLTYGGPDELSRQFLNRVRLGL